MGVKEDCWEERRTEGWRPGPGVGVFGRTSCVRSHREEKACFGRPHSLTRK